MRKIVVTSNNKRSLSGVVPQAVVSSLWVLSTLQLLLKLHQQEQEMPRRKKVEEATMATTVRRRKRKHDNEK